MNCKANYPAWRFRGLQELFLDGAGQINSGFTLTRSCLDTPSFFQVISQSDDILGLKQANSVTVAYILKIYRRCMASKR